MGEIKTILTTDVRNIHIEEPLKLIGEIHGTDGQFLRLQSAFREIERENQILRTKYIKWQEERPNIHAIEDKNRIINSLTNQIATLTNDISSLRSQSSVSVNISGNTQ